MGVRMMIQLQAHPAVQAHGRADLSGQLQRPRAQATRSTAGRTRCRPAAGGALMDASPPLRRCMIDTLIADGPSIEDLADDDGAMKRLDRATPCSATGTRPRPAAWARPTIPGAVTDPSGRVYGVDGPARLRRLDHADGAVRQHQHPDHHGGREDRRDDPERSLRRRRNAWPLLRLQPRRLDDLGVDRDFLVDEGAELSRASSAPARRPAR